MYLRKVNIVWQAIKDWVSTLLENVPVLLIVAGLALFLLGAAGSIGAWMPVKDNVGREFLGGGGVLCVIIGILEHFHAWWNRGIPCEVAP
jgi:hypothetical protein